MIKYIPFHRRLKNLNLKVVVYSAKYGLGRINVVKDSFAWDFQKTNTFLQIGGKTIEANLAGRNLTFWNELLTLSILSSSTA